MVNLQKKANINNFNCADFGPINLVVIQPTSFCNLDCDYCYLPDRHLHNRLSLDLIEPIFKNIFTSRFFQDDFSICWHAGEPLTVPIAYYEKIFAQIEQANQKYNQTEFLYDHSFQTNGTLITQAWCDFFRRYPVHVGVSIDGPAFVHDAHRQNRGGGNSHELAMRGIRYLQKNNIPYSTISVITEDSLDYPDEIFSFFVENEIMDVAFNMEETEGINESSSLEGKNIEQRYRQFIARFWELTTQQKTEMRVREFETLINMIYTQQRLQNTDMNKPFVILNVDYQGNFSTFDPELLSVKTKQYGDFIFGNVLTDSLESVCYTDKFLQIYQDINDEVQLYRNSYSYFDLCGGGAGSNKYWENGQFNSGETQACRYRIKILTDIVVSAVEKSLNL